MTKTWGETSGPPKSERREVDRIRIENSVTIRLTGPLLPRYVYWVTTTEGRKMPQDCLQFIREEEKFDPTAKDPFSEIPPEIFKDKAQFAYVCNVIDRSAKKVKLFDLKRTIFSQIAQYAQNPEYGDPADDVQGYDLTITKEKTGPLPQNVKYTVVPARSNSPLTEEEKEMDLYDLGAMFKRPTYEEQKEWLIQNTTYFAGSDHATSPKESAEDL
jgi:hypothetical protein